MHAGVASSPATGERTNTSAFIDTPGGCSTVQSKYTCVSENVVYAIKYRTCHKVNIGETGGRLGNRFRGHLRSTRLTDTDLPVGLHFAPPGHIAEDILVSVIRSDFSSTTHRRSISSFKARMIFKHQTLHPGGLNTDFNFL